MSLMIDFPFPGAAPWIEHFMQIELPVLRHTVHQLTELRAEAEAINTRKLAAIVTHDPLMTLRVFRDMQARRAGREMAEITTIERALVMMGIENFYRGLDDIPLIEHQLKGYPKAMLGLLKVIARARHAAGWARDWALLRQNAAFEEITLAALLHDFVEILMFCLAPNLAVKARDLLAADTRRRTAEIQQQVFGAHPDDIAVALCSRWGLPELLLTLMQPGEKETHNGLNVRLAVDLARHVANGWNDAALPDDFKRIEEMLHIGHRHLLERLGAPEELILAARAAEIADDPLAS